MEHGPCTYEAARFEIQDVELLVVFLEPELHVKTTPEQRLELYRALRESAAEKDFRGELVAVWADRWGRTRFIAAPQQHAFFRVVRYEQLHAQVSTAVTCSVPSTS